MRSSASSHDDMRARVLTWCGKPAPAPKKIPPMTNNFPWTNTVDPNRDPTYAFSPPCLPKTHIHRDRQKTHLPTPAPEGVGSSAATYPRKREAGFCAYCTRTYSCFAPILPTNARVDVAMASVQDGASSMSLMGSEVDGTTERTRGLARKLTCSVVSIGEGRGRS